MQLSVKGLAGAVGLLWGGAILVVGIFNLVFPTSKGTNPRNAIRAGQCRSVGVVWPCFGFGMPSAVTPIH